MLIVSNGMYFLNEIKKLIKDVGGEGNDNKERPVVALIQSEDDPTIYWAIPVGDAEHRSDEQMERIKNSLIVQNQIYAITIIILVKQIKLLFSL